MTDQFKRLLNFTPKDRLFIRLLAGQGSNNPERSLKMGEVGAVKNVRRNYVNGRIRNFFVDVEFHYQAVLNISETTIGTCYEVLTRDPNEQSEDKPKSASNSKGKGSKNGNS